MVSTSELKRQGQQFAQQYGIDWGIFDRQIQQESGWNPNPPHSSAGAIGIAQFMPATAQGLGINPNDPIASLRAAAKLDSQYLQRYGDWPHALAAYNWGPGRAEQWNGSRWTLPLETRTYLDDILGSGWPQGSTGGPTTIPDPGGMVSGIGSSLTGAIHEGISGWWSGLFTLGKDVFIAQYSNQICLISGIGLIVIGGIGLASHTTIGGAAIDAAAATGNPIAIGAAGIKAASGGGSGSARRIVARRVNVSMRTPSQGSSRPMRKASRNSPSRVRRLGTP